MRARGKIRYLMGWIGLCAYLFFCLTSSQTAMALSAVLAGPHDFTVVSDGNHQDIVFTHEHINAHLKTHSHSHGHGAHHHHNSEDFDSVFGTHKQPHPDHVVHMPEHPEQISIVVPVQTFDLQFLYDLAFPPLEIAARADFYKTVSRQALAKPPPILSASLAHLSTIILLI